MTRKHTLIIFLIFILVVALALDLNKLGTRSGVTDAQVDEALPGDALLPAPTFVIDRASTLPVSAEKAWPWVAQLGKDRAGWYAPLWLENLLGKHSATTTVASYQNLQIAQVVPDWGGGSLKVLALVPNRYVVYGSLPAHTSTSSSQYQFIWTLALENKTASSTSLHLRLTLPRPTSGLFRFVPLSLPGLIDYATDAVMFLGLKEKLR